VIDLILSQAEFRDVEDKPQRSDAEAVEFSAGGEPESEIPEAKPEGPVAE
jgi:hypothetical protein